MPRPRSDNKPACHELPQAVGVPVAGAVQASALGTWQWTSRRCGTTIFLMYSVSQAALFTYLKCPQLNRGPKGPGEEDLLVVSRALAWYNSFFLSFFRIIMLVHCQCH